MSYRMRLTLLATFAVAFTVLVASGATYLSLRSSLYRPIDRSLMDNAEFLQQVSLVDQVLPQAPRQRGGALSFIQVVDAKGAVDQSRVTEWNPSNRGPGPGQPGRGPGPGPSGGATGSVTGVPLKITDTTRSVLSGKHDRLLENQDVSGEHLRVMNARLHDGGVVQIARSLQEVDSSLAHTRNLLLMIVAGSIVLAGFLGLAVTQIASRPVRRLERTMGEVAEDADMSIRIPDPSNDEIGRLAHRFNAVLDSLSDARRTQQQLVEDASHELRTPLTSIKTNLEALDLAPEINDAQRQLLADVDLQIDELTELVANLVELAHGKAPAGEQVVIDLHELVASCVARAERAANSRVSFHLEADPCQVLADPDRLQSALDNLLSNAVKWSPSHGGVDVTVRVGVVTVTDEGPGVPDSDKPFVFDRFYRSSAARSMPGAGLGLAIVKAVADEHDGAVEVSDAPDGTGAQFRLSLPLIVNL